MKDVDTGIAQYLTFNVNITSGFPFYASEAVEFLAMIFFSLYQYCTFDANSLVKVFQRNGCRKSILDLSFTHVVSGMVCRDSILYKFQHGLMLQSLSFSTKILLSAVAKKFALLLGLADWMEKTLFSEPWISLVGNNL